MDWLSYLRQQTQRTREMTNEAMKMTPNSARVTQTHVWNVLCLATIEQETVPGGWSSTPCSVLRSISSSGRWKRFRTWFRPMAPGRTCLRPEIVRLLGRVAALSPWSWWPRSRRFSRQIPRWRQGRHRRERRVRRRKALSIGLWALEEWNRSKRGSKEGRKEWKFCQKRDNFSKIRRKDEGERARESERVQRKRGGSEIIGWQLLWAERDGCFHWFLASSAWEMGLEAKTLISQIVLFRFVFPATRHFSQVHMIRQKYQFLLISHGGWSSAGKITKKSYLIRESDKGTVGTVHVVSYDVSSANTKKLLRCS